MDGKQRLYKTVGEKVNRGEHRIAGRQFLRYMQQMSGDEIVRIARELVLKYFLKRRAECFRLDKPEEHAADGFEQTVYSLQRDAGAKRSPQKGS